MINPMIHVNDYNKISDNIMILGSSMILKFSVQLSYNDSNYGMQSFHKEFGYYSSKVGKTMYSINRTFTCFLSIENTSTVEVAKDYIHIGYNDMMIFRTMLDSCMRWFTDQTYSDIYAYKNGRLTMMKQVEPKKMYISGKYIAMEPAIYVDYLNNTDLGIRIYLNSDINYTEIPFSTFCGLHYFVSCFNMYESAQQMLNYIQRPEFGTNLVDFSKGAVISSPQDKEDLTPKQKSGRNVNVFQQKKSLKDKLE